MIQQNGKQLVVGGTSAVAPLMAALVALLREATGKKLGFINPLFYTNPAICRDIITGDNGTYVARPGFDCCTGIGVPDGTKVLAVLGMITPPPPGTLTATLSLSTSTIQVGQSATLAWSSSNAVSASLLVAGVSTGGATPVAVSGSMVVTPQSTTSYTLTVTDVSGKTYSPPTVTLTVSAVPPPASGPTQAQVIGAIDNSFKAMIPQVPRNVKPWFIVANPYVDAHVNALYTSTHQAESGGEFAGESALANVPWESIWKAIQNLIVQYGPLAKPYIDQYIDSLNLNPFIKSMLKTLADSLLTQTV